MKKSVLEHFNDIAELETGDGPNITVDDILPGKCEIVRKALHRLEAIDNAVPSEALKCVEYIKSQSPIYYDANGDKFYVFEKEFDTIKQSLLKAQKEHKALEIIKRNIKVAIEYGEEKKYISCALVFYIDNKKTIYVVDEAIKEQTPEHFKELELLKEVLE